MPAFSIAPPSRPPRDNPMLDRLLAKKTDFATDPNIDGDGPTLKRTLGPWGLTALGIGAVIGGGIFVITGQAAAEHAGPAIVLSFIIAAICCSFTALCYAEFATLIPMSGSSYSYAYATLGELAAWFIGWNMVLEYGVSASAVAVSWTGYFTSLLDHMGLHLPPVLTNAPFAFVDNHLVATGALVNLPAVAMVLALTWLCYIGIRESSGANTAMVALKVALIVIVIIAGWHYVDPKLWHPFIPAAQGPEKYGWGGVMRAATLVFFAYIGFEATSTAAQEAKNPQRDLPIGTLASLAICTVLYIGMAAVLTGLLPFDQLGTSEPVVTAVKAHPELNWLRWLVEIGALIGLSSVVLVMIIAQPRIFMIMGRDGMLPPVFAKIHPKYRTPYINTVITGVGIAAARRSVSAGYSRRPGVDGYLDRILRRVHRRADPAPYPAGSAAYVPRACGDADLHARRAQLPDAAVLGKLVQLDPDGPVDRARILHLLRLQLPAQQAAQLTKSIHCCRTRQQ